ncbi:MAG: hypothetical protein U9R34_05680 [Nanoarchaeota archaeon]|nr:hypothetical protein [Nanoarchaeota archaeon]
MAKELGDIITGERAIRYAMDRYFAPETDIDSLGSELTFVVYNGFTQEEMIMEVLIAKNIWSVEDKRKNLMMLEDVLVEKQKIKGAAELSLFDIKEKVVYVNNSIDRFREVRHKLTIGAFKEAVRAKGTEVKFKEKNYCENHLMGQRYESLARDFVNNSIIHELKERFTDFKDVMRNILISPLYIPIESWYLPGIFDDLAKDKRYAGSLAKKADDMKNELYLGIAEERFPGKDIGRLAELFDGSYLVQKQFKAMALKNLAKEDEDIEHKIKQGLNKVIRIKDDFLNYQIIPIDNHHILNLGYAYGGQARNILHYILFSFDPEERVRFIYTGKAGNLNPKGKVQDLILSSSTISEHYLNHTQDIIKDRKHKFKNLFHSDWKQDMADPFGIKEFYGGVMGVRATVSEKRENMKKGYEILKCDAVEMELYLIMGSIMQGTHNFLDIRTGNILWSSDIINNSVNRDLSYKNVGRQGAYLAVDMAREAFRREFA